jgi:flavin-dependent dehydrogenase
MDSLYWKGGVTIRVDIVGGSISGLSTAISLKEHDPTISVVVHEKYGQIGYNHEGRRCGEAHDVEPQWEKWRPQRASFYNEILGADIYIGAEKHHVNRPPGTAYMLNRQEFIRQLARAAEKLDVTIQTSDRIKSVDDLDGDYIVDASGCPSTIRRELGLPFRYFGTTYQQTLEQTNCFTPNLLTVVFTPNVGYYWIFPRNPQKTEVNVGVGILGNYDQSLKALLESFKSERGITGVVNYMVGGLVPLGLQPPLRHRNILFVGDAGVGAFPLSGQGIYRALLSGDAAGACLARRQPKRYPFLMQRQFIKWDSVGLFCVRATLTLRKIYPAVYIDAMNFLAHRGADLSIFTHGKVHVTARG